MGMSGTALRNLILSTVGGVLSGVCAAAESIVFVGAHPDDTEGFAATAFLLRDKYELHVVDLTRGDAGLGPKGLADGSAARLRSAEEAEACKVLGATPHFLFEVDGDAYASKRSTDELTALLKGIRPKAVFTHWPVDAHPDHVQTAATVLHAVRRLGFPVQVYFYEVCLSQTRNWDPFISVDVTKTIDLKAQMLRKYVIGNGKDDWLVKTKTAQAQLRGREREPACAYAETFTTFGGEPFANGVLETLDETSLPYGTWELKLPDGSRGWLRITGRAKAGTLDAWLLWNTKKPFRITAPERKGTFDLAGGRVEFSFQTEPGNEETRCRASGTVRGACLELTRRVKGAADAAVTGKRIGGDYPSWL